MRRCAVNMWKPRLVLYLGTTANGILMNRSHQKSKQCRLFIN